MEANAENPYLADFYADMPRWSFHSQIFFLSKRVEHHHQLVQYAGSVLQDRTVYEDAEIFARNLFVQGRMMERDYETYRRLYQAVAAFLPPPDLIVYLQSSVGTLLNRIHKRGRDFEQQIDPDYLAQLNRLYDDWITDWTRCPVLTLQMDEMDFQHNQADFASITARLDGHFNWAGQSL
jgi:deoxyadenosine/deoxycytidine kinase